MPEAEVIDWVRSCCAEFAFDVAGVFKRRGDHRWPLKATDPEDLEAKLLASGHLLPLPKEPAALANILEVAIVDQLLDSAAGTRRRGGQGVRARLSRPRAQRHPVR